MQMLLLLCLQLLPSSFAQFNFEEIEKVTYDIILENEPLGFRGLYESATKTESNAPQQQQQQLNSEEDQIESSIIVSNIAGQRFVCSIPQLEIFANSELSDHSSSIHNNYTLSNVTDLIGIAFSLRRCLVKTVGWWTYEFCQGREIQQYHLNGKEIEGEVVSLGLFIRNEALMELDRTQQLYFSQIYEDGSLCDWNSKLRSTEVRFMCDEDLSEVESFIHRVNEPSTCNYLFIIHVGSLCKLAAFAPIDTPEHSEQIVCTPLLTQEQTAEMVSNRISAERRKMTELKLKKMAEIETARVKELLRRQKRVHKKRQESIGGMKQLIEKRLNQLIETRRAILEMAAKAEAIGTDPNSVHMVNFDLKVFDSGDELYGDLDDLDESKLDEDRGDLWFYFHYKDWNKADYPITIRSAELSDQQIMPPPFSKELREVVDETMLDTKKLSALENMMAEELGKILKEGKESHVSSSDIYSMEDKMAKLLDRLEEDEHRLKSEQEDLRSESRHSSQEETEKISTEGNPLKDANTNSDDQKVFTDRHKYVIRSQIDSEIQNLEEKLSQKLKGHSLNSQGGHKVHVKVITSGYYDNENEQFHMLSSDESEYFSDLIVSILGGRSERVKEVERAQKMENNFLFVWKSQEDGDNENR